MSITIRPMPAGHISARHVATSCSTRGSHAVACAVRHKPCARRSRVRRWGIAGGGTSGAEGDGTMSTGARVEDVTVIGGFADILKETSPWVIGGFALPGGGRWEYRE